MTEPAVKGKRDEDQHHRLAADEPAECPAKPASRLRRKARVMVVAGAIAVIALGALLTFGPAGGPMGGFEPRIAGIVLMLGGSLGLLLVLLRTGSRWSQSTARSRQDAIDDRPPPNPEEPVGHDVRRGRGRGSPGDRPP
ncbi:hypothetical protein [Nonomuraea sp. NPDC049709]|uniref:hypothetical protein n=1 Tax=Nonomuraea sp. NPDC049709 TaxID=3154736 RepID=UPI003414C708